jgi:phosphoribosylformylglycinamidine cyclo-ligase
MNKQSKKITYKSSGVDIDEGNKFVREISSLVKSTQRSGADASLGGFGSVFDLSKVDFKDPLIISATDGVGTKLKFAFEHNIHSTIGIDLVAMCANDIIAQGGEPMFFLDYYATSKLSTEQAKEVIIGITEGCKLAGCALVGGETAELPGFYQQGHYDLAGFCVGLVERENLLPKKINQGDFIIGLPSHGIHSNGYSLVHKIVNDRDIDIKKEKLNGYSLIDLIMRPTKIYQNEISKITKSIDSLKAIAHITGGGLTENLPRVFGGNFSASIDLNSYPIQPIFSWIKNNSGLTDYEMMETFNCGIGMVLIINECQYKNTLTVLKNHDIESFTIGRITDQKDHKVLYNNQLNY